MRNKKLFFLLLILVTASFFRLWQITSIPSGLFPDEAANGLDILQIFQGNLSPFFERGLGREALFFYLQAISVAIFGIGVWQLHVVSAIIGILTVFSVWLLARKLFNARVAFFAAFFMATSSWHTTLSRTGFRAILVPLFSTLFFYFIYSAFKEPSKNKRILFAALAGASLALGFYTYVSFRAMIPILGSLAILVLVLHRKIFISFWREFVIVLIAAFLVLTPLIIYFAEHPSYFFGRAGYVSIFNPDLNQGDVVGTFLEVAKKTFLMFFIEGDLNWRHNVSGFAMLNPIVGSLFALGFFYSVFVVLKNLFNLLRKKYGELPSKNYLKHCFLTVWFLGMLGPELVSAESIPHGLRAVGSIASVFLFPALMLDFLWKKTVNFPKFIKSILFFILTFSLLISLLYDYYLYFKISADSPEFHYAYRSDLTTVSNYLNARNLKEKTYLSLDEYSVQTPEFLTAGNNQPYILVNPAKSYIVKLNKNDQIIFTQSTIFDAKKFEEYNPEAKIIKKEYNKFNQEIMRIYENE